MPDIQFIEPKEGPLSSKQRFMIFIAIAIFVTFLLVTISIVLYNVSGTAQLDLSRPGYKGVSAGSIQKDSGLKKFPSSGAITQATIDEFKKIYDQQATNIKSADAFIGDPLSPEALGIK